MSTFLPFPTLAPHSESVLSLAPDGEPGASTRTGNPLGANQTSAGLKPWASNSSFIPLPLSNLPTQLSSLSETTWASLKDGSITATEILLPMKFSSGSINSCTRSPESFISAPSMCPVNPTSQMALPGAFSGIPMPSSLTSLSPNPSAISLKTPSHTEPPLSTVTPIIPIMTALSINPHGNNKASPTQSNTRVTPSPRFISAPPLPPAPSTLNPLPYRSDLSPSPSPLRPHCLAKDRLLLWKRFSASEDPWLAHPILSEADFNRILSVIDASWGSNTKAAYGAGLLVFHVFCDSRNVPEIDRCPVSQPLLLSFISTCAGTYSGNTLANYIAGIHAWHMLHGRPWILDPITLKATIEGAARLAPPSSKRPQRNPFTPDIIALFKSQLNLEDPLDVAVFACITVCFWGIARVSEFTVPSINTFDPTKHITRAGLTQITD